MKRTPLCCSNECSFWLSCSASLLLTTPAASVNQFFGSGGMSSASAFAAIANRRNSSQHRDSRDPAVCCLLSSFCFTLVRGRRRARRRVEVELHLWRLGTAGDTLEVLLRVEAAHPRDHAVGKLEDVGVVRLRRVVEAPALHRNAVFRPLELRLQLEEIFVGPQLGIALDDDEKA